MSATKTDAAAGGGERAWSGVVAVYLSGLLQGLTLVSFPASSTVLKEQHGFDDAQYGLIFLPQVALAVVGSLAGGALAERIGLRRLLAAALAANALSQAALYASAALAPMAAFAAVLAGTAALGLGFGLSAAPLNGYPPVFFPRRHDASIVALHTVLGAGLAAGPLVAGHWIEQGHWALFPLSLFALALALVAAALVAPLPEARAAHAQRDPSSGGGVRRRPTREAAFWLFAAIAVLYAFGEGTFSNWVLIYLAEERGLAPSSAALALSLFWAALAGGRLLVSLVLLRVPAERVWVVLPALMAIAFVLLPYARSAASGAALFAFAGLACSAFFPLTIGLASRRFEGHAAWTASALMAALMIGIGLGSFVIGPLRAALPLVRLYPLSALYPLAALALAAVVLKRR